jgi:hypothetical protein
LGKQAFEKPGGDHPANATMSVSGALRSSIQTNARSGWAVAIYDEKIAFTRTAGQITHVTAPDIDAERHYLFHDLEKTGALSEMFVVDDFQVRTGCNGGGDQWRIDGR